MNNVGLWICCFISSAKHLSMLQRPSTGRRRRADRRMVVSQVSRHATQRGEAYKLPLCHVVVWQLLLINCRI